MLKKDITKKMIEEIAEAMNKVMGFDPPIETGRKIKRQDLFDDVLDASLDIQPEDLEDEAFTDDIIKWLKVMGWEGEVAELAEVEPDDEEGKPEGEPESEPDFDENPVSDSDESPITSEDENSPADDENNQGDDPVPETDPDPTEKPTTKTKVKKTAKKKTSAKKAAKKSVLKVTSNNDKDEFGFKIGSKRNLFAQTIKIQPMTMANIKSEDWNEPSQTFYQAWGLIKATGKGHMDGKVMIIED